MDKYFEWKLIEERRKVMFVKLKVKGSVLAWWKRVEVQKLREGKAKIATW